MSYNVLIRLKYLMSHHPNHQRIPLQNCNLHQKVNHLGCLRFLNQFLTFQKKSHHLKLKHLMCPQRIPLQNFHLRQKVNHLGCLRFLNQFLTFQKESHHLHHLRIQLQNCNLRQKVIISMAQTKVLSETVYLET